MGEEMIAVQTADFWWSEVQRVNAKSLFEFLELNKKHYSRWIDKVIIKNEYALEGEDFILQLPNDGLSTPDAIITIDFAKRIAMRSSSKKWEDVRKYFVNVEKSFKKVIEAVTPKVPQTYLEALEAHLQDQKKLLTQAVQIEEANKTITLLSHTRKLYTTTEIAKELGMRSAIALNDLLEKLNIQFNSNGTWVLKAWYSDKRYDEQKQTVLDSGKVVYHRMWTQAGREFLLKKLTKPDIEAGE